MSIISSFIHNVLKGAPRVDDKNAQTRANLMHVISQLSKRGIKCNYDPLTSDTHRVLLYSSRYNSKNYELASECNGIIFDYDTWEILCFPPELPNDNFDDKEVGKNFDQYDLFWAEDGTVVNLYCYNGSWRISTARGIDQNNVNWRLVSYLDAVTAAGLDFTLLDTSKCYTFGFTHPQMHFTKKTHLWYISSWSPETGRIWVEPDLPFAVQRPATSSSWTDLLEMLNTEYSAENPVWGVIMRSRDPTKTGPNSTLLLESSTMRHVRMLDYDRSLGQEAKELDIPLDEYRFTVSLLDEHKYPAYLDIYPDNADKLEAAYDHLLEIVQYVLGKAKNKTSISDYFLCQIVRLRNQTWHRNSLMLYICQPVFIRQWHRYLKEDAKLLP